MDVRSLAPGTTATAMMGAITPAYAAHIYAVQSRREILDPLVMDEAHRLVWGDQPISTR